ncbi:DUF1800 domain-containing protein [Roseimaritima ulvae]|uniref:DUF1800 domain-containing protein n=1 Tax=Roseimaritima ulvae TaxID=980254 RepID=A0A5B9QX93_9BACT|nr:DUF1800 domain-containing protein [Roseimaritima ulvae]QEG43647.1 hypothetical protein UC8_56990 [Roseimaritima ulvae]
MNDMNSIDPDWAWRAFEPTADRPWSRSLVAHLYRRAGFGADLNMLDAAVARGPAEVVDELVLQGQETSTFRSVADTLAETVLAGGDPKRLSAAWVYRLLRTPHQLLEKTTLFWHGHFATSAEKVEDARMMWNQNRLLREHALGNFAQLAQAIAQDPAMLIYLDSAINRKAHPNENFSRELMELFCLGEGNYSEQDVQQLARCFTGWEIKNKKFRKNRYQHDEGTKSFLGQSGNFDGQDGVRIVLEQPQLEQFLAAKWFRFFVSETVQPSASLLQPLADAFRQHDLRIAPVLRIMLGSNLFFSQHALGQKIKSPVELIVGMLRCLKGSTNTQLVANGLLQIGQGLFYPPNVKGWDGGRSWINSATLLGRANLLADILEHETTQFDEGTLRSYLDTLGARSTDDVISHFETCLLPVALNESTKARLRAGYDVQSDDRQRNAVALLHAFTTLPECQLG